MSLRKDFLIACRYPARSDTAVCSWLTRRERRAEKGVSSHMLHAYLNYNWLKNTDVTEIVSQLGSTDALFSASETRVKKVVCSRKFFGSLAQTFCYYSYIIKLRFTFTWFEKMFSICSCRHNWSNKGCSFHIRLQRRRRPLIIHLQQNRTRSPEGELARTLQSRESTFWRHVCL